MYNDNYTPEEHSIAMEVANRLLHADYLLIDTRSAHEYAGCRVIGSISCPSPASFADFTKPNFSLSDVGLCMNASDHTYLMGDYHRPGQKILIGVNYRGTPHQQGQNHHHHPSSSSSSASHLGGRDRPTSTTFSSSSSSPSPTIHHHSHYNNNLDGSRPFTDNLHRPDRPSLDPWAVRLYELFSQRALKSAAKDQAEKDRIRLLSRRNGSSSGSTSTNSQNHHTHPDPSSRTKTKASTPNHTKKTGSGVGSSSGPSSGVVPSPSPCTPPRRRLSPMKMATLSLSPGGQASEVESVISQSDNISHSSLFDHSPRLPSTHQKGVEPHQELDGSLACNSEISEENGVTVLPTPSFHLPPPAVVSTALTSSSMSFVSDAFGFVRHAGTAAAVDGNNVVGAGGGVASGVTAAGVSDTDGVDASLGHNAILPTTSDPLAIPLSPSPTDLNNHHLSWCDPSYHAPAVRFVCLPLLYQKAPLLWGPANLEVSSKQYFTQPSCIIDNFLYLSAQAEAADSRICGPGGVLQPTHIINLTNRKATNYFEATATDAATVSGNSNNATHSSPSRVAARPGLATTPGQGLGLAEERERTPRSIMDSILAASASSSLSLASNSKNKNNSNSKNSNSKNSNSKNSKNKNSSNDSSNDGDKNKNIHSLISNSNGNIHHNNSPQASRSMDSTESRNNPASAPTPGLAPASGPELIPSPVYVNIALWDSVHADITPHLERVYEVIDECRRYNQELRQQQLQQQQQQQHQQQDHAMTSESGLGLALAQGPGLGHSSIKTAAGTATCTGAIVSWLQFPTMFPSDSNKAGLAPGLGLPPAPGLGMGTASGPGLDDVNFMNGSTDTKGDEDMIDVSSLQSIPAAPGQELALGPGLAPASSSLPCHVSPRPRVVLVHCAMGISRSPAMVIYYLMRSQGLSLKQAYAYVKYNRPITFPNRSFMLQLIEAEKKLYPQLSQPSISPTEVGKIGGLVSEYSTKTFNTSLLPPPRTGYDMEDMATSGSRLGQGLGQGVGVGSPMMGPRNGQQQYKGLLNDLANSPAAILLCGDNHKPTGYSAQSPGLARNNHDSPESRRDHNATRANESRGNNQKRRCELM